MIPPYILYTGKYLIPKSVAAPVVPAIASSEQAALVVFPAFAKVTESLSRAFACKSLGSGSPHL